MRQWKSVKGALFVSSLSDVLELGCLLTLALSFISLQHNTAGQELKGKKNKSEGAMLSHLESVRPNVEFPVHLC